MAKAPITQLSKAEIVKLAKGRCKHGHSFLEHYGCYLEQAGKQPRIGFFDIEASNLNADFGIMLCYSIKESDTGKIVHRTITQPELVKCLDKEVVKQCIEDLQKYDTIVTYYGTGFDIPFVRARAMIQGLAFPEFGLIQHKDLYYLIKSKFKISRRSLENACRVLLGKTNKTRLENNHWLRALQGKPESLRFVAHHCDMDVIDLEALYNKTIGFAKHTTKSI